MKFWSFFALKLAAIGGIAQATRWALHQALPVPDSVTVWNHDPFAHDLGWTFAMLGWGLFCAGLLWLAVLDQRYRCRTCLRRLKMPVSNGRWDRAFLFEPPKTEYICVYGHGTMKVPEVQITGREEVAWDRHDDMWRELEELSSGSRR